MTYYDLQGLLFLDFIETTAQGPIYNYIYIYIARVEIICSICFYNWNAIRHQLVGEVRPL